ncbi:hypothetical protein F5144DRAFT_659009, partial [Chaetomium tenue]
MQFSQILALAFATTAMAAVFTDNSPIPTSVALPADAVVMDADTFGTAVDTASAKLRRATLHARDFSIYVCEHSNFNGACLNLNGVASGVCYNINGIWNDVISSTDTRGHTCTMFQHQGCKGDQSTVNGRVNWGHMNDKISSYRCYE